MTNTLLTMYITLTPPIISGVLNMIWCKLPIFNSLKKPIDAGIKLKDNKRLFGDNKTWKGLIGYLIINIMCSVIWGFVCKNCGLNELNYFYYKNTNTFLFNVLIGFLLGLAYALFELPNSFLKRRLNIEEGKNPKGLKKILFVFLDQADSVFGCALVAWIFYDFGFLIYVAYIIFGAMTHIVFNIILYILHLRKNMF